MPDMYEIVDAGFEHAEEERDPAGGVAVVWRHPLPDGREATVRGERLCLGPPGAPASADGYCYATPMSAVLAAARWIEDGCPAEPDGWTRHLGTGRNRLDGAARADERVWVCPRHLDRLPKMRGGRLFCPLCGRAVTDAVQVPWPPPLDRRT